MHPWGRERSDRAWTSMLSFYSWGPGVVSILVIKSKFGPVKTQDQRNQIVKHSWVHLLRLILRERWRNSWCLSLHLPPHILGALFPLSAVSVYESLVIDIYLYLSLEECFCGGIKGRSVTQGNSVWLLTKVFFPSLFPWWFFSFSVALILWVLIRL